MFKHSVDSQSLQPRGCWRTQKTKKQKNIATVVNLVEIHQNSVNKCIIIHLKQQCPPIDRPHLVHHQLIAIHTTLHHPSSDTINTQGTIRHPLSTGIQNTQPHFYRILNKIDHQIGVYQEHRHGLCSGMPNAEAAIKQPPKRMWTIPKHHLENGVRLLIVH